MYFKSLEVQGFKSFADKIKLDFKGGVTAVVGPNGSGKSNISDAMRWVMGEMSARSLRGSKMEDVIFNGTQKRKPMGFAEVTIVMDNSDHTLNIDFDEVSVTRRVYRSGESEYYINKAACRLKDIHELFMDTGLGRDGYSIVGQGKIDEILSAKSEERRHVFDEAAGITKFRYRKEEAERKLESAEENLVRLSDIIGELESQLEPLRIQSEKAKKYLILRESQKNLEVNLWLNSVDENRALLEKVDQNYKIAAEQLEAVNEAVQKTEEEITQLKEVYRNLEADIDSARARLYQSKSDAEAGRGDIRILEASIENNRQNILRLEGEIQVLQEKAQRMQEVQKQQAQQLQTYLSAEQSVQTRLEEAKERLLSAQQEEEKETLSYEQMRSDTAKGNEELSANLAKIEGTETLEESLKGRCTALNGQISETRKKKEEIDSAYQTKEKQVQSLEEDIQQRTNAANEQQQTLQHTEDTMASLQRKHAALENDLRSMSNKKSILEDLENHFDGYSKSVKAVMNECQYGSLQKCAIYGPVSRLMKVKAEYVTAVEALMGGAMHNIVTEREEDAKAAIEYLKATKKGRVTFLPVSSVKAYPFQFSDVAGETGFIGIASDLIEYENKFENVMKSLLGRSVVVDTMDHAIAIARRFSYKFRIATLQGEVLNSGGSITGGSVNTNSGTLSRGLQIQQLAQKIAQVQQQKEDTAAELKKAKTKFETMREEVNQGQKVLWEQRSALATKQSELSHLAESRADIAHNLSTLQADLEQTTRQIKTASQSTADIHEYNRTLQEKLKKLASDMSEKEAKIAALRERHSRLDQELTALQVEQSSVSKDVQLYQQKIQESQEQQDETASGLSQRRENLERCQIEITKAKEDIAQKKSEIERLDQLERELADSIEALCAQRTQTEKKMDEKEEEKKSRSEESFRLRSECVRIENQRTKVEGDIETILSKLWDEYELTYSAAQAYRKELQPGAAKELAALKSQIKQLGNINLDAIEEYTEKKERYDFLQTQYSDLEEAKAGLLQLIDELTDKMQKMFSENFTLLNEKFGETFRDLFHGGNASICLSDPEDILGSGIEINVQPPGKNLQSITLLSGGEKAFTAIALLFAILKVKPTHFCIFDEIEAALDDVNVFRFADYLKAYSKYTQFIVITHRKGTMEAADTLYGVTMQEKGVTTLLALDMTNISA